MIIQIHHQEKIYQTDLTQTIDISIPLEPGVQTVNCFYAPPMKASPLVAGDFIGSTQQGGAVNFFNIELNPHGNGTHTECVGHIAKEKYSINKSLKKYHYITKLISVAPLQQENGDRILIEAQFKKLVEKGEVEALVIRTIPNDKQKLRTNYSGTNPPYIDQAAMDYLVHCGIKHLLVDLPSVDREEDDGQLLAHRSFWKYPNKIRENATISELIFVPDEVKDGLYLLNLQIASFEIDVSPSKPVLYVLEEI